MFLSLIDMSDGADSALPVPAVQEEPAVNGGGEVANDQDSDGANEDAIVDNVETGVTETDFDDDNPPEYGGEAARRSHAAGMRCSAESLRDHRYIDLLTEKTITH